MVYWSSNKNIFNAILHKTILISYVTLYLYYNIIGGPLWAPLNHGPPFWHMSLSREKNPRLVVRVRNSIPLHVGWIIISGDFNYWQTLDSFVLFTLKYKYILHIASRAAAASKAWHWLLLDTGSPLIRSTYNKTRSAAIMSRSYLTPTQTPAPFSPANT